MLGFRKLIAKIKCLFGGRQDDAEFDTELREHLGLLTERYIRSGMTPEEAAQAARRQFGNTTLLKEERREMRTIPALEMLWNDLRYAVRMLRKNPGFATVAILSLALGIGTSTALFSLVDDLLLRSLPVRDPDRLVQVQLSYSSIGTRKVSNAFPSAAFGHVRSHNDVFSEIVGFNQLDRPVITMDGVAEPNRQAEQVSVNFFRDLGVMPVLGRIPDPNDGAVAVISHRLWRTRFGAGTDVLGRTFAMNGEVYSIIGVAPARFLGLDFENPADFWLSSHADVSQQMIARLKPGVTVQQAQAAMQVSFQQLVEEQRGIMPLAFPGATMQTELLPAGKGISRIRDQYERPLLALTVLVILVLLAACANVGNLLAVRNTARGRELTVRIALGARRSRLILQHLTESAVLAVLGGVFALLLAPWGVSIILSLMPLVTIPEAMAFHLDLRVAGFTALVSLLSALLFGLAPALRAAQADPAGALGSSQGSTPAKATRRLGRVLVAFQVGFSVILLVGAGLFVQTLRNLVNFDVGFNSENLLQVSLDTQGSGYSRGQVGGLHRLLLERVAAIPGVYSVAAIRNGVMQGSFTRGKSDIPGRTLDPDEAWDVAEVGPSFFETMGIPLLLGRTFTAGDHAQGRQVLMINESFAKSYFPSEDPVGKQVGNLTIIGVVKDAKLAAIRRNSGPMAYYLTPKEPDRISALEVRTAGDAGTVIEAIRQETQRIHPRLLVDIRAMRHEIDRSVARERMVAATSGFFSLLGLLLASMGIFGVASYAVAQRTKELGIRMALGAGSWPVIRESLRETLYVFGAGLAGGVIAAFAAVRLTTAFLSELLFGITATDMTNIAGAVLVMAGVALAACILPARRATRIDPIKAIRYE